MAEIRGDEFTKEEDAEMDAEFRAQQQEYDARNKEINDMFGINTDDEIDMRHLDYIDFSEVRQKAGDDIQFTDDDTAEHVPGLQDLINEIAPDQQAARTEPQQIGEST